MIGHENSHSKKEDFNETPAKEVKGKLFNPKDKHIVKYNEIENEIYKKSKADFCHAVLALLLGKPCELSAE